MTEQKEAVWVLLASLKTDITPLTPEGCQIIEEMLRVLAPFDQATRELSEEKSQATTVTKTASQQLAENLRKRITDTICSMESLCDDTGNTVRSQILKIGFVSQNKRQVK